MIWRGIYSSAFIQKNKKMKRIFNLILIAGVTIFSYSCATTETPTPTQMLVGSWDVVDVFADFQGESTDVYSTFVLERDGSFVLILADQDELRRGTWTASGNTVTLNSDTGEQIIFTIIYQDFAKMQLDQSLTLPSGTLLITYLLDRSNNNSYD